MYSRVCPEECEEDCLFFSTGSLKVAAAFRVDCFRVVSAALWLTSGAAAAASRSQPSSPYSAPGAGGAVVMGKQGWDTYLGQILGKPCALYLNSHSGKCSLSNEQSALGWDEHRGSAVLGLRVTSQGCFFLLDLHCPTCWLPCFEWLWFPPSLV